jgi:ABC-type sugar transport system substrate-binding protein
MIRIRGKRAFALAAAATPLILAASLSACSSAGSSSSAAASAGSATASATAAGSATGAATGKIAFVIKPLDNTYFGAMAQGAQDEAKKDGLSVTVIAADSVTDNSGQASKLSALVSAGGYGCYIVNPTSATNLINGLVPVSKAGTPIVNLDLPMDTSAAASAGVKISTYVGTNNETAGAAGGQEMLKLLKAGDTVVPIGGIPGDPGSIARIAGFAGAVHGTLKVSATIAGNDDEATAKSAAASILRQNPGVKGFFTVAGVMAMGIEQAVEQAGLKGKVAVIGVDGIQQQLQNIIAGGQPAAIEQFPYLMGVQSVQACAAAMAGKKLPADVQTPVLTVTRSNAQAALSSYPKPPASFTVPDPFS